jgi:hypothetical protein
MSDKLVSPSGLYELDIQDDGNIVEYRKDGSVVRSFGVDPHPLPLPPTPPEPEFVPLPRLTIRGQFFALETGDPFTAIQASDFNLLNRWQHGEDIEPVLMQREAAGFNLLRVWTKYDLASAKIGTFLDLDYAVIPGFLDVCARAGLYVEFTAYTSTPDPLHWDRLVAACAGCTNVLLELINEADQPANTMDLSPYAWPAYVPAAHGSNGAEAWPVTPHWSYATFHTNGASEEQRKVGHNAMEIWSGPTLTNETSRYPDVGMWGYSQDGKWIQHPLERQKQLAFDSAAGASLLCAGSCWHSVHGKTSELWDANEFAVAQAWAAGAKSVPLEANPGPYQHRTDLETPDLLRVYQRDTRIVKIRK